MFGLIPYRKDSALGRRDNVWNIGSFLEDFFNDSFVPAFVNSAGVLKADIKETEKEILVDVEVPGVKKEDIKLELRDDILNITVTRDEDVKEEGENYIRRERRLGSCSRSFHVPDIVSEEVKAKYADGVLKLVLPKASEEKDKKLEIDIE